MATNEKTGSGDIEESGGSILRPTIFQPPPPPASGGAVKFELPSSHLPGDDEIDQQQQEEEEEEELAFKTVDDAIKNIVEVHSLQNDLLSLDDSATKKAFVGQQNLLGVDERREGQSTTSDAKMAKINALRRQTSHLYDDRKEKDSHHAKNQQHMDFIYDTIQPRVSTSVTLLKKGFIERRYSHVLNRKQQQQQQQQQQQGRKSSSLGVDWEEVQTTLQQSTKAALVLLQQGLGTSEGRLGTVVDKVMGHVKKLGKLEALIEKHPPTAAMRQENLNRLQRRLVEVGLRAVALEVLDIVRLPLGMAISESSQKERYQKMLNVLPDFLAVIETSIQRTQCELLLCELGEQTDLPVWTRKHFHIHSDTSSQKLVKSCIDDGFWPRVLAKFNGITTYEHRADGSSNANGAGAASSGSLHIASFFEAQQSGLRQQRATMAYRTQRFDSVAADSSDNSSVYGLRATEPGSDPMFEHTTQRYWLLYKGLSVHSRSFLEALSKSRLAKALGLLKGVEQRAGLRVHRSVVEALGEEGIGLGKNEGNYYAARSSAFVRNRVEFVAELQLRMLFDQTRPALAEAISQFYHRMMKGDSGKVDTPFSNVKLTVEERTERLVIVKKLRQQKAEVEKMFALMNMLDMAAKIKHWKDHEDASRQLILADLLQWTNMDSIQRTHVRDESRLCGPPGWKYKYVGLQSLDEAMHSLRSCPDAHFHSLMQKSGGGNSKWSTWLCREISPAEQYIPRELRRKITQGAPLTSEEQEVVTTSMERTHSCVEYLMMCIPLWLHALWDNLWNTAKLLWGWDATETRYFAKQHDKFKDPILGIVLNVLNEGSESAKDFKPPPSLEESVAVEPWPAGKWFDDDVELIDVSKMQVDEAVEALTQCLIVPYDAMVETRRLALRKSTLLTPAAAVGSDGIPQQPRGMPTSITTTASLGGVRRELGKEGDLLRHAKASELNLSVDKFHDFARKVGKSKALQVEMEGGGKQLVMPCRLKIIFKTLRNLDVESMNLDAELTILTWVGLDGLDPSDKEQARKLKIISWHVRCQPIGTALPLNDDGTVDQDFLGLPGGGLKFRINEKEYIMSEFSPNVVMPKKTAEEQAVAITCRGTFSFNYFDRNLTLRELQNYPFDVTPIMLKYELTSFQVTPPKEAKRSPFKVRMNLYNLRTTHGSDGRVDSIAKLVSYKSSCDKLPEYDIDLSHTCVWFESENKLVERTGKYIKYYPTMVIQIRLFRDPGFALLAMVLPLLILSFITILFLYVDGVNFFAEKVNNLSTQMLATFTYLLFVRTRLPPISRLTNIDKLIAGTIFMVIVVILQTCWEGAFLIKTRKRGDLDDQVSLGDLDDEEYSRLPLTECGKMNVLLRYLMCGQSHDWHMDGSNMDDYYQDVYANRHIGDSHRPFLLLVGGTWVFMTLVITLKTYHFYSYQRPRYHLAMEMARRINWKQTIEDLFCSGASAKEVCSEALFAKTIRKKSYLTDVKVVTSNYLGDASQYVLGGAHSLQFGYMTEGEFNSANRRDEGAPPLKL